MNTPEHQNAIAHCISKVVELASLEAPDRRALLQLGYNLGRLSELTGAGRGPFWDAWKTPVSQWDRTTLQTLAHQLHMNQSPASSKNPDLSTPPEQPQHPPKDSALAS